MAVTIHKVDFIDGDLVIVDLSDGRTVHVTLDQILSLNPKVFLEEQDSD